MPVDDRRLLSGVVDEQRLAGAVVLPHDHIDLARPRAVVLTEPAVVKALRMRGLVLLPEQEERHALALELAMHVRPVGQATALRRQCRLRRIQRTFQRGVVKPRRVGYAGEPGSRQIVADGALTNADTGRDLPLAPAGGMQPKNFSDLSHGHPRCRHRLALPSG